MLAPGDTVRIFPPDLDYILGRIVDIETNKDVVRESSIPVHPDHDRCDGACPFLKIQMILTKDQSLIMDPDANWPIVSEEIGMATRGLTQVSSSNLLVWIHPGQIIDLISVFHTDD